MIQIGEVDPNTVLWRYLTCEKFASLIDLNALWFSKLQIFEDAQGAMTPEVTRRILKDQHQDMERQPLPCRCIPKSERLSKDYSIHSAVPAGMTCGNGVFYDKSCHRSLSRPRD